MRTLISNPSLLAVICSLLFSACATQNVSQSLNIDATSHTSKSQDSRVQHLVLHFTTIDNDASIRVLTQGAVSSHYLVSERVGNVEAKVFQLVPEDRRAFHAGLSSWKGQSGLNASSIGIEIVNKGYTDSPQGRTWHEYQPEQMDLVIALSKDIIKRHQIRPDRVVGHSDIAPGRKNDPGPKFPWKRFAEEGLIPWPNAAMVRTKQSEYEVALPDVAWFQEKLNAHGFSLQVTGIMDAPTQQTLEAFQMKYRQSKFDGMPDAETAALLAVATSKDGFIVRPIIQ
jgi:N-acetylmuramoyl-L-alanine amidase